MAFITSGDKVSAQEMLDEVFATFMEPIAIYQTPQKTVISTDPNFNFAYGDSQPSVNVGYTAQSGIFNATVEYLNRLNKETMHFPIDAASLAIARGYVRISVSGDAQEFLKNVEEVEFDGEKFRVITDPQSRGMFARNYYDYLLQRLS